MATKPLPDKDAPQDDEPFDIPHPNFIQKIDWENYVLQSEVSSGNLFPLIGDEPYKVPMRGESYDSCAHGEC